MAPTFRHGKGTRVLVGPRDLSPYLKLSTIQASCGTADVTCFQQNDSQFIPGLTAVTASFNGLFSFSSGANSTQIDKYLQSALGGSTLLVTTIAPEGDSTGRYAMMLTGIQTKVAVTSPITDAVAIACDLQGSSGYDGGVILQGLLDRTSTQSGGTVGFAGSTTIGFSTGGGVGHLHVVASSAVTNFQAKVQHSTTGSTWVDLVTFTAFTGPNGGTFQRSTVAGNIKEKLRATCNSFTGGAGKHATYAVAFARRGKQHG